MKNSNSFKRLRFNHFPTPVVQIDKPKPNISNIASIYLKTLDISLISRTTGSSTDSIHLRPNKPVTVGRDRRRCEFVFEDRQVSKQHFQFYFDVFNKKVFIVDGVFWLSSGSECSRVRVSLNGVFVDGIRVGEGQVTELRAGNEVMLVCGNEGSCRDGVRVGLIVERIVFMEEIAGNSFCLGKDIARLGFSGHTSAYLLSNRCRQILSSNDPVLYIQEHLTSFPETRVKFVCRNRVISNSRCMPIDCFKFTESRALEINCPQDVGEYPCKDTCLADTRHVGFTVSHEGILVSSENNPDHGCKLVADSKQFVKDTHYEGVQEFLYSMVSCKGGMADDKCRGICIGEEGIPQRNQKKIRVCVPPSGTKFYLNRLQVMGQDRGANEMSVSLPELLHPVETLDRIYIATFTSDIIWYPLFPEAIAFGKDRKKLGIACHHPKLFVLQREDSIRVIITSANLVAKQWHRVTNTVWWQDFPRASAPDYMSLFTQSAAEEISQDSKTDFAAQLAGFMTSLVADAPGQHHWILELTKYDFKGAAGHLVASVPGIYSPRHPYISDSRTQLKKLAAILRNFHVHAYGMLEIILRRNQNILADPNAVSVIIGNSEEFSEGDCVQLGFLPRDVAMWVAPLSDLGLFAFSAYVYPKEVLASAFKGSNNKGPNFSNLPKAEQPAYTSAICSLVASIQRCAGLWRLHEILGHHKWPEYSETDFIFGSSSIGSVNAQFLAAFSAATGKLSSQFSESEESDPDWDCWSASQELRDPSIRIIFPTIERVKTATCRILPSKYLLCFSQKTWLRLRTLGILHDAVPYPVERMGHPMHVKVARRRFRSKVDASSSGWVYCGSHNFSAAAWGRPLYNPHGVKADGAVRTNTVLGSRLHVCNHELGIVFIVPPPDTKSRIYQKCENLDDIVLPFVVPAPRYRPMDTPATKHAMREALAELNEQEKEYLEAAAVEESVEEEIPDEEEEEEVLEASDFFAEEKEDEKAYAESLWVQVDSSES